MLATAPWRCAGTTPVIWTAAVTRRFSARRGLALGVALSGTGICTAVVPKLTAWALQASGWRAAYLVLAATPALVALPLALLFLPRSEASTVGQGAVAALQPTLAAALGDHRFWILALSSFAIYAGGLGLIGNLVPLLTDRGLSLRQATDAAVALGISSILSRLFSRRPAHVPRRSLANDGHPCRQRPRPGGRRRVGPGVLYDQPLLRRAPLRTHLRRHLRHLRCRGRPPPLTFARLESSQAIAMVSALLFTGAGLPLLLGRYPAAARPVSGGRVPAV
jgi:hypothetical protein